MIGDAVRAAAARARGMRSVDEPMMEVGKQFVLPILRWSKTERVSAPGWSPLGPASIIPYQGGVLGKGDVIPSVKAFKGYRVDFTRQRFIGKTPAQLVAALKTTPILPGAADAMDLPPDVRARQIWAHQN